MDFNLVTSTFDALRIAPPPKLTLLNAQEFILRHFPPAPPDIDMLILDVDMDELAVQLQKVLLAVYPREHRIFTISKGVTREMNLGELNTVTTQVQNCVYVPSLGEGTSFESFAEVVAHLRAPDGCPWDKEQTHETLRKHLLEEAYETLSAMDDNSADGMREEFGDLLLQIVLNSQIGSESGDFSINIVIKSIYDKIVGRHPHVFGDVKLDGVEGVLQNWEKLKEKERGKKKEAKGILDGVPTALPALNQAQEFQDRAARVGFDWREVDSVLEKIREEIDEVKTSSTQEELAAELGDLFFVLVNLARWKKVDAEAALRGTNVKFKKRFGFIEQTAKAQGRNLSDLSLEEMDSLWDQAKAQGM